MRLSRWWRLGCRRSRCPVRAWREPASHCTPAWQRAQKGASWASFPGPLLTEALLPFMGTYPRPNSCPKAPPANTTTPDGLPHVSFGRPQASNPQRLVRRASVSGDSGKGAGALKMVQDTAVVVTLRRRRALRERAVALCDVCPYCRELFPNGDHLLALDNPQLFALRPPGIYLCLINFCGVYIYLFFQLWPANALGRR